VDFPPGHPGRDEVIKRQRLTVAELVKDIIGNEFGLCLVLLKGGELMKVGLWFLCAASSLPLEPVQNLFH
jgi:hypothetical protein